MRLQMSEHFFQRGNDRNFDYNVLKKGFTKAIMAQVGEEIKVSANGSTAILRKVAEDLVVAITGWSRYKKPVAS